MLTECRTCLCTGRVLPKAAPWNVFLPGTCAACGGLGWMGAVRLRTLHVGDQFECTSGFRFEILRKNDGAVVTGSIRGGAPGEQVWLHNPPVRKV